MVLAAVELFVKSVRRFNKEGVLKYTWPRFTKLQGISYGTALDSLLPSVVLRLRREQILESQAGTLEFPNTLWYVPNHFTDGAFPPRPLIAIQNCLTPYLATHYRYQDVSELGVRQIMIGDFLASLKLLFQDHPEPVYAQSLSWHSRVAQAITYQVSVSDVEGIKIIPLRDGSWTNAQSGDLCFPELDQGLEVPDGINFSVIARNAAGDPHRRALYRWLGAWDLTITEVCELVLRRHGDFSPWTFTKSQIRSHAYYLFRASKTCKLNWKERLRFLEHGTSRMYFGRVLYLDLGGEFHIREFFPDGSTNVHILDLEYESMAPNNLRSDWIAWLQSFGMWSIPKPAESALGPLTLEFKHIMKHFASQRFLQLLRANWSEYEPYFSATTKREIGEALVECLDGTRHRLKDVFLPEAALLDVPLAMNTLHFVDVLPMDDSWRNFDIFGVGTRQDLRFYATILTNIKHKSYLKPSKEQVAHLYSKAQDAIRMNPTSPS